MRTWLTSRGAVSAVVVWTVVASVARALRPPNDFSEAHWLLDYRFGFIKRGLVGSLCSSVAGIFDVEMTAEAILWLSVATFCVMAAALLAILARSWADCAGARESVAVALVFASSPFFVSNAHLLGYFDALLYIAAIASAALMLSDRPVPAALVSSAAILSHEGYLLLGFPLVCLASAAAVTPAASGAPGRRDRRKAHLAALTIPVVVFAGVALRSSSESGRVVLRQQLAAHLEASGFVATMSENVARDQTAALTQLIPENVPLLDERLLHAASLKSVAPSLVALVLLLFTSFHIRVFGALSAMLAGAICAPLLMHAVAWDTARIWTYTLGGTVIAYWILAETRQSRAVHRWIVLMSVAVVILNAFSRMPLLDGRVERFSESTRVLLYLPAVLVLLAHIPARERSLASSSGRG